MPQLRVPSRWRKLLEDMARNKTRTLLVVMSIAVGIASVGMIRHAQRLIVRDLYSPFYASHPHSVTINLSYFPKELASDAEALRSVEVAQARRSLIVTTYTAEGEATDLELNAVPNPTAQAIDRYSVQAGASDPGLRQVLLERKTAEELGLRLGDMLYIESDNGNPYELKVIGIVHDLTKVPPAFFGQTYGYVSMDTLRWMGQPSGYNRLDIITARDPDDLEHVLAVVDEVEQRVIDPSPYQVIGVEFALLASGGPGSYWAEDQMRGMFVIFDSMGIMSILLSSGLVINTISAILTQQVREIGIMRSIGATRRQIVGMYLLNVLGFSLMALVIAIPAGLMGGWELAKFVTDLLNVDLTRFDLSLDVVLLQVGIGLLVPVVVSSVPILSGTRISVYDAIYQYGVPGFRRRNFLDRLLNRIHLMSRPLALAIRNTFRKKARLIFTLVTMTLAGAMFTSVFSTRLSLQGQVDEIYRYLRFDLSIQTLPTAQLLAAERETLRVPGVQQVEGWAVTRTTIAHPDGSQGEDLYIRATPHVDPFGIEPRLVDGRWLLPQDRDGVVLSKDVLDDEPWIKIGSRVEFNLRGQTRSFRVVGIVSRHVAYPVVYMNYQAFMDATDTHQPVSEIRVQLDPAYREDPERRAWVAQELEDRLDTAGLSKSSTRTQGKIAAQISEVFDIILILLLIMASLLALVGGLGLAGAMSMNVMERTREIGVLRAVGASSRAVRRIVLVEGLVVGLTSWVLGVLLAIPLGRALSNAIGMAVFGDIIPYVYSIPGGLGWLALALLTGVGASIAPARRASRLTVREVLAYE